MASPKTRKPPEGGSAKGARKAPAGSVEVKQVAEAPPYPVDVAPPGEDVVVTVGAATAPAIAPQPTVHVKTGTLSVGATVSASHATARIDPAPPPRLRRTVRMPRLARRRESRRRSVRTGPRRARAPGSKEGSEPSPSDLAALSAALLERARGRP